MEAPQLQCSDKVNDVPVVQVVVRVSWKVPRIQFIARAGGHFRSQQRRAHFQRMVAVKGFQRCSAFFALLRVVPELSASFRSWGALDEDEFFVIEGSGGALTPRVELPGIRPPVVHESVASLAQSSGSSVCG